MACSPCGYIIINTWVNFLYTILGAVGLAGWGNSKKLTCQMFFRITLIHKSFWTVLNYDAKQSDIVALLNLLLKSTYLHSCQREHNCLGQRSGRQSIAKLTVHIEHQFHRVKEDKVFSSHPPFTHRQHQPNLYSCLSFGHLPIWAIC